MSLKKSYYNCSSHSMVAESSSDYFISATLRTCSLLKFLLKTIYIELRYLNFKTISTEVPNLKILRTVVYLFIQFYFGDEPHYSCYDFIPTLTNTYFFQVRLRVKLGLEV